MVLYNFEAEAFDPNHSDIQDSGIKNFDVYSDINDDKVGNIKNILVDETGRIRYLVIDTSFWVFGKQVLLPIGLSRIDYSARRIHAKGLTKSQVENLPEFQELEKVNYDYEELLPRVYRTPITEAPLDTSIPLEASLPLEASASLDAPPAYAEPKVKLVTQPIATPVDNRDTYTYEQEPSLYDINERDHQTLKLYEEQLIAKKNRVKRGEVKVGKHVETETVQVSVPVEKQRVIVERTTPKDGFQVGTPSNVDFREEEMAHIDIYEETVDIQKQPVVREEVKIKKVVEQDKVKAKVKLRREELDVNTHHHHHH
ncbi:DUF2382 domain-containing protein [Iningainema tapete]|uniref:DUF2382 domain-containing protein n=1 Tax=Iningainema tapete BLCC-T55 TaxID=2748662 RepID=A0A8J7BYW4_9CYAN|nr:DUF2382 domain-containing protein [Iningainema tapete]MBD2776447.1 DUF2382 domain-containing protein [Iningainema tapete BLCC-T55]